MLNGLSETDTSSKKQRIEKVVNALASEMNVNIRNIRFFSDPESHTVGGYVREDKSLILNLAQLDNEASFMVTIIHELRHAQQYDFMYGQSELAQKIKAGIDNYVRPTGKVIKNAQYFSNIVEVDAELFSYYFTQNIFEQLEKDPTFMEKPEFQSKLAQAKIDYNQLEHNFNHDVNSSLHVVEVGQSGRKAIYDLTCSYAARLLSKENADGSLTNAESSQQVTTVLDQLISGKSGQEVIDFTSNDLYTLKYRIFKDADSHEVLRHLDDPFMQYIAQLEDRFEIVGQYKYEKFVSGLKSRVAKPLSEYVKKYNLPHTEGDYASMLDAFFENYHEISIQNLLSGKEDPLCSEMDIYLSLTFDDLKPQIAALRDKSHYATRVPMALLQERAENAVQNRTYSAATTAIPEFAEICKEQMDKNMFGKYLTALQIPNEEWEQYSIAEAWDVLKKTAPKFVMQHIFDEKISKFQEEIFDFCLKYGDVSVEKLHKELFTHPILGLKLRAMQKTKYEELPAMLKYLHWNGRPVKYIVDPNKKKKDEQALT